jgi:hypothetical protein
MYSFLEEYRNDSRGVPDWNELKARHHWEAVRYEQLRRNGLSKSSAFRRLNLEWQEKVENGQPR